MKIKSRHVLLGACLAFCLGFAACSAFAQKEVWTDPEDSTLPKDFQIQGEYVGEMKDGKKIGAQVIALGKGAVPDGDSAGRTSRRRLGWGTENPARRKVTGRRFREV